MLNYILNYIIMKHNEAVALTLFKIEELYLTASDEITELAIETSQKREAQESLFLTYNARKHDWVERETRAYIRELGQPANIAQTPDREVIHQRFMEQAGLVE